MCHSVRWTSCSCLRRRNWFTAQHQISPVDTTATRNRCVTHDQAVLCFIYIPHSHCVCIHLFTLWDRLMMGMLTWSHYWIGDYWCAISSQGFMLLCDVFYWKEYIIELSFILLDVVFTINNLHWLCVEAP